MAVWVTRPDEKGIELTAMLNQAGVAAIHCPLFRITTGRELNLLPNAFSQLKAGDYVVAVSRNAVDYATQTLHQTGFLWRNDLCYFAVGQQTARYFAEQSEQAVCYPYQQENSEGMLALEKIQQLENKSVLLLRGNGGRELFPEQIRLRGANLQIIECYQREPIDYNNVEQTSILKRAGINSIVATSAEILNAIIDFVPKDEHNWLKSCQLVTVSQRIANIAQQFGWNKVIVSTKADNANLLLHLI